MPSRRTIADWSLVILGALVLAVLVILVWRGTIKPEFGGTVILALTAWVILWYTVETMRLRREAETRAKRDREPHIYFDVAQPIRTPFGSAVRYDCRFTFKNDSTNAALARIRVRLSTGAEPPVLISKAGYDGKQVWEILPFFEIHGVFYLEDFSGFDHFSDSVLNVQVDVYGMDRGYLATLKREYRMKIDRPFEKFWPEVATSLPELPHSDVC
jgi:hypothetical protein